MTTPEHPGARRAILQEDCKCGGQLCYIVEKGGSFQSKHNILNGMVIIWDSGTLFCPNCGLEYERTRANNEVFLDLPRKS